MQTDRQPDVTKIDAFCNFAKAALLSSRMIITLLNLKRVHNPSREHLHQIKNYRVYFN